MTFNIDANGGVHVSAKDMATGKEQSIKIEVSSGLSDSEIDRMVHDAEKFAEEDKKKAELIQLRNESDHLIYTVEKTLKDHGDKVGEDDKKNIEAAIDNLRTAMNGDSVENIKSSREALEKASHKLAEEMYKQAQQAAGPQPGAQQEARTEGTSDSGPKGDGAVDADFEVVDGDKK